MSVWSFLFGRNEAAPQKRIRRAPPGIEMRQHNAALMGRLTADWPSAPVPVDQIIRSDLRPLRARSRWEAENDDYAARFLHLLETNVVGDAGITPQPHIQTADGQEDVAINKAIAEAWADWGGDDKFCDMAGTRTWNQLERLFIRTTAEDGEFVCQEVRGKAAGKYGYALHPIDAELLDQDAEQELDDGQFVRLGVQCNEWGRPIGYWIKDQTSQRSSYYLGYFGHGRKFYPADQIIHAFAARRIGQKRGLPWMSTSLFRMRMLAGLEDSASVAARAGAQQMGTIEREVGEDVPLDGEQSQGGPRTIETEPGVLIELKPGEKLAAFNPNYPSDQLDPFMKGIVRGIAAGLNVSYNSLANDLEGVNYSSMRSGRSDDNDAWRILQRWELQSFHKRVFRNWLEMALLTGNIQPATGENVSAVEAARIASQVEWHPRGWESVDPMKEIKARVAEIAAGLRSREEIIKARGGDPDKVWRQLTKENRMLLEAGVITEAPVAVTPLGRSFFEDDEANEDEGGLG